MGKRWFASSFRDVYWVWDTERKAARWAKVSDNKEYEDSNFKLEDLELGGLLDYYKEVPDPTRPRYFTNINDRSALHGWLWTIYADGRSTAQMYRTDLESSSGYDLKYLLANP